MLTRLIPLAAILSLAACGAATNAATPSSTTSSPTPTATMTTPATIVVYGDVMLGGPNDNAGSNPQWVQDSATSCSSAGAYQAVQPDADVTVTNQSGEVVGTAKLKAGNVLDGHCVFVWNAGPIDTAKFYRVTIDPFQAVTFTEQDAQSGPLTVAPVGS